MTKELTAILALSVTLLSLLGGVVYSYGRLSQRVDDQTKQIDTQTRQIEGLSSEVKALNGHLIGYVQLHRDPPPARRPTR